MLAIFDTSCVSCGVPNMKLRPPTERKKDILLWKKREILAIMV